jgi:hypothetical protein
VHAALEKTILEVFSGKDWIDLYEDVPIPFNGAQ